MTIQYIDKNGERAQLPDREALVQALRDGKVGAGTQVYVPARQGYVPLEQLFDLDRLRRGDTSRRETAPAAKPRPELPKKTNSKIVGVLGVVVLLAVSWGITQGLMGQREKEQENRRQLADDLSRVKGQMQDVIDRSPASGASDAAPASSANVARMSSPIGQLVSDHLVEIRALNAAHERNVESIVNDNFMTPQSLSSKAGIAANRTKLAAMRSSVEEFFSAMERSKTEYFRKVEQIGPGGLSPENAQRRRDVMDFLQRAHQANLSMMDSMEKMNDFAAEHHPSLRNGNMVFKTDAEVARWKQLAAVLDGERRKLEALEEENKRSEKRAMEKMQNAIGELRKPVAGAGG
ncbi:hypothetical protein [Piscinibacter terrae]|uniref:Uncharacterized protein n=1 Tax=Piscinibacter terrae TaxID=2496871 RepID=A0A3N7HQG2_9BURK|nr:hypothetical protein [Albitalea terrae]RQP24434.1 hypothetical protein DZC73_14185 [Albitalea terrae]